MKIINSFTWDIESSGEKTIKFNNNNIGDTVASELYLNPLDDCTIEVKGFVSDDDTEGVVLTAVDIAGLEKVSEVTSAGNYLYVVGSYYKVIVSVTGTATVLGKYLF